MITVSIGKNINDAISVDYYPDTCPICWKGVEPKFLIGELTGPQEYGYPPPDAMLVFKCPRSRCSKLFIAFYEQRKLGAETSYALRDVLPKAPRDVPFSEEIRSISPTFVEVFSQSHHAEEAGLTQVAGAGYRKSLEFLIKDFAVHRSPDRTEVIKAEWLMSVIKQHVDDGRVVSTATRATWLGNDESHYVRKWETKDISDLKRLIQLSANWIENAILTEKYEDEMKSPEGPEDKPSDAAESAEPRSSGGGALGSSRRG